MNRSLFFPTLLSAILTMSSCGGNLRNSTMPVTSSEPRLIWLHEMDLSTALQEWGAPMVGRASNGNPIRVAGSEYQVGVGSHAHFELMVELDGMGERFIGFGGVDDATQEWATVRFQVWLDDEMVYTTPVMKKGMEPAPLDVDIRGAHRMILMIDNGGDTNAYDHANWIDARIVMAPGAPPDLPRTLPFVDDPQPIAMSPGPQPAVWGPRVIGTTPGRPFLHRIAATGERPMTFEAIGLPPALQLDPATGIISGTVETPGEYEVVFRASNHLTSTPGERRVRIVAGTHRLAQTPPMGWNSWNCWAETINEDRVRSAADGMVDSGLANVGYQYVVIDDHWEGGRDEAGNIIPNEKFRDMKALGSYIHAKGLKFGIYSSPGPTTCGGREGSYGHELQDARTWAGWGVDFLKYDWCSYAQFVPWGSPLADYQKPYRVMRDALDQIDRDIVYSLCQYGQHDVWKWGPEVGGNMWRTSGDIYDSYMTMFEMGEALDEIAEYAGPGHWNDPDMMVLGRVGWGDTLRPTKLLKTEQISHMTLWCITAAPLMLGNDLADMDDYTIGVAGNPEAIDVNQDPLGIAGRRIARDERLRTEVWARPLFDGTHAVALFNRGFFKQPITVEWSWIGREGSQPVRDLWQWRDLGGFEDGFTAEIPAHGAFLLKVGTPTAAHDSGS